MTKELTTRVTDVLMRMVSGGLETEKMQTELRALGEIMDDAEAQGSDGATLAALRAQVGTFVELLQSPDAMASYAGAQMEAMTPYPDICDAIEDGDLDAIREELKTWDINARFGEYDSTVLYHAMSACGDLFSLEVVNFLLDEGADPRLGLAECNALHGLGFGRQGGVAPEDLAQVIRRCVDLGADIDQQTEQMAWTPLICAASEFNEVATEALLMAGADPTIRSAGAGGVFGAGQTAAYFAHGNAKTAAVFARYALPG
ncbi:MAG: ankyrin repeat domain-containing protein [Pseudomonadota bacterium]